MSRKIAIEIQNHEQLCRSFGFCRVIYAPKVYNLTEVIKFLSACKKLEIGQIYLKLPIQAVQADLQVIEDILSACSFTGISGDNLYALYLARQYNLKYFGGVFHNIYNVEQFATLFEVYKNSEYTLSVELNAKEIKQIYAEYSENVDFVEYSHKIYVYVYGKLPLMHFNHCPKKTLGKDCKACKDEELRLIDQKYSYAVKKKKVANCYHTMYNPQLVNLSKYALRENLYLNFDGHSKEQIVHILKVFCDGKVYIDDTKEFTSLHFRRGVL